ncbi:hypothetical protein NQZ68_032162 [Dissostichus eleginoides]|nr:hypothetical protein NQZ68_032162 [Dissostichus eleginoides]
MCTTVALSGVTSCGAEPHNGPQLMVLCELLPEQLLIRTPLSHCTGAESPVPKLQMDGFPIAWV